MDSTTQIEEALEALRTAIARVVREEQLRDRLTGLGNDQALTEWINEVIRSQRPFWIAFVEVDRFKAINDRFGYTNADILLKKIAEQLTTAASFFPEGLVAFRAHGDEFFLAGTLSPEHDTNDVEGALDHIRSSISHMKVRTGGADGAMRCTVSIGWVSKAEAPGGERELRHRLELAASAAKHRGRNTVVRFSEGLAKAEVVDLRSDCATCHSSYSVSVPRSALADDATWRCPNCGTTCERPPVPEPRQESKGHPI